MSRSTINPNKKSRGRPRVETEQIGIRFPVETIEAIDVWRNSQDDLPIRTEAVRRLVDIALRRK